MKILFDTDIGTNVDDALALAYLLKNPGCELMGITTVTGDGQRRAAIAAELCRSAGAAVPVLQGSELPLVISQSQGTVTRRGPMDAIEFLRSTIRSHPGEISLLTTGPLTTIALLFLLDPEIPSLLHAMVCMAGVYYPAGKKIRPRETNISLDPHAAVRVLSTAGLKISLVGLDATLKCRKSAEEMAPLLPRIPLPLLRSMLEEWFTNTQSLYFHDPLAAAALFRPEMCRWQRGIVRLHPETGECFLNTEDPVHNVAADVDADAFFEEFFGIILDSGTG